MLTLVGELAALWCWWNLQGSLAPSPSGEGFGGSEVTLAMAFVAAFGFAFVAYLVSLLLRRGLHPKPKSRLGLVFGLVAVIVFAGSELVAASTPYGSSFAIDTPPGWAPYPLSVSYMVAPEYGLTFRASVSGIETPENSSGPTVPMLGASVVGQPLGEGDPHSAGACLEILDDAFGPSSWVYTGLRGSIHTSLSPAVSGGDEVLVKTAGGDRIYGLGISRTRMIGLVPERLCYLLVVSVPADSTLTNAQVNGILSTFRLR